MSQYQIIIFEFLSINSIPQLRLVINFWNQYPQTNDMNKIDFLSH
ncbi:hypothetical protein pb186bvf_003074 [Paramecium bursaria]